MRDVVASLRGDVWVFVFEVGCSVGDRLVDGLRGSWETVEVGKRGRRFEGDEKLDEGMKGKIWGLACPAQPVGRVNNDMRLRAAVQTRWAYCTTIYGYDEAGGSGFLIAW